MVRFKKESKITIALAAAFTSELEGESLDTTIHKNLEVTFAPYNQIFQQLLEYASPIRRLKDGMKVENKYEPFYKTRRIFEDIKFARSILLDYVWASWKQ